MAWTTDDYQAYTADRDAVDRWQTSSAALLVTSAVTTALATWWWFDDVPVRGPR